MDLNAAALELGRDAKATVEANLELQHVELPVANVLDAETIEDILVVPALDPQLVNAAKAKGNEHMVTQDQVPVRPDILGDLECVDIGE